MDEVETCSCFDELGVIGTGRAIDEGEDYEKIESQLKESSRLKYLTSARCHIHRHPSSHSHRSPLFIFLVSIPNQANWHRLYDSQVFVSIMRPLQSSQFPSKYEQFPSIFIILSRIKGSYMCCQVLMAGVICVAPGSRGLGPWPTADRGVKRDGQGGYGRESGGCWD